MSIKYYGIFLAYAPTVNLRKEGLGRHLVAFLKAAAQREDVRFVVACPSWLKKSLLELCESEAVDPNCFDIITPTSKPVLLRIYDFFQTHRTRPERLRRLAKIANALRLRFLSHYSWVEASFASARNIWSFLAFACYLFVLSLIAAPFALIAWLGMLTRLVIKLRRHFLRHVKPNSLMTNNIKKFSTLIDSPKDNNFLYRLFRFMEKHECALLLQKINSLKHIAAWYSPTAFWPAFNRIHAPRLMCVPDVVLADFPVGFAKLGGNRFLNNFQQVESSINGCEHFVTYSEQIKWDTLVDRYAIKADSVHVIHHAPNIMNHWVTISGFPDVETTSRNYCHGLFRKALYKSSNPTYIRTIQNNAMRFLFYASQFRPNKNILTLLKAYEYLLRKRFIGHKLILTGRPQVLPELNEFIKKHHLENEVLCLHDLTTPELAACYRLADLAINPSLSEGGCPFTFTEAVSVNTPVVMARIPVTMEVLTDPSLDEVMFFDPYNWKDMANRIEWGIHHRNELLAIQKPIYEQLSKRTWGNVVEEYVNILDSISTPVDHTKVVAI